MKSAYELAMERLREEEPDRQITEEQKQALAQIDEKYEAKFAVKKLFLEPKIAEARAAGNADEAEALETQLRNEKAMFEDDKEREKARVREE